MIRILTVVSFLSAAFIPLHAEPATYLVGPERTYTTLQAVAPLLSPGDVVEVDGGYIYPGDIVFSRPGSPSARITIRGIRSGGGSRPGEPTPSTS